MVETELGDVPPEFGWVLVLFEPNVEPMLSEGFLEPSEVRTVSEGVLEVDAAQSGFEPLCLSLLIDWMTPS